MQKFVMHIAIIYRKMPDYSFFLTLYTTDSTNTGPLNLCHS